MSGGYWDYKDQELRREVFGWAVDFGYGLDGKDKLKQRQLARRQDPLEDKLISELAYDFFCLLHSYDWAISGDTSKDQYLADLKFFKDKWIKKFDGKAFVDDVIADAKADIYKALEIEEVQNET